jgi:drug/metabolite transporter (DMT)-like permease
VAGGGGDASLAGDLLVLASAALTALFIEAQSRLLRGRDAAAVTAVQMSAAAVVLLPIAWRWRGCRSRRRLPPRRPSRSPRWSSSGRCCPSCSTPPGRRGVPAELAGRVRQVEPLVGAMVGAVLFHDVFGAAQTLGATAILGGILLSLVPSDHTPVRHASQRRVC